ncbi:hypothetical protein F511_11571 [Dorcoceras hygrometricum]|uniref:Uncharacterized protein n=1 Tax=Dorcoceras hygrometricum TaxID=472368 RepID=A0A2Z7D1B7_9LAMI|nr:hypothetical protein F511_11571 [Dorcoceras hygrometricum]
MGAAIRAETDIKRREADNKNKRPLNAQTSQGGPRNKRPNFNNRGSDSAQNNPALPACSTCGQRHPGDYRKQRAKQAISSHATSKFSVRKTAGLHAKALRNFSRILSQSSVQATVQQVRDLGRIRAIDLLSDVVQTAGFVQPDFRLRSVHVERMNSDACIDIRLKDGVAPLPRDIAFDKATSARSNNWYQSQG